LKLTQKVSLQHCEQRYWNFDDENQNHNVKLSFWPFIQILFEKVAAAETESNINTCNFWREN